MASRPWAGLLYIGKQQHRNRLVAAQPMKEPWTGTKKCAKWCQSWLIVNGLPPPLSHFQGSWLVRADVLPPS